MDGQARQNEEQMAVLIEQVQTREDEIKNLIDNARDRARGSSSPMTSFQPFDSSSELRLDYLERFMAFLTANSIPGEGSSSIPYKPKYGNLQVA